eukprot:augustus_masked-scaffold_8-processed-gene-4.54-mRNA-1 protein AED:0.27 eAED:0.28 QI:0/-1/0/1/-1/1/1/0/339
MFYDCFKSMTKKIKFTKLKSKAKQIKEEQREKVNNLKIKVKEVGEEQREKVNKIKNKVKEVGEDQREKVNELKNKVKEVGEDQREKVNKLKNKVKKVGEDQREKVNKLKNKVKEVGEDQREKTKTRFNKLKFNKDAEEYESTLGLRLEEISSLQTNFLQKVASGERENGEYSLGNAPVNSLWKDGITVVHFLRRFGDPLCRKIAEEISSLAPTLEKNGVQLVGVGLGEDSLDSFLKGDYWKGLDLYLDEEKQLYKELKLGQGKFTDLLKFEIIKKKFKAKNVEQSNTGDKMQLGGTYVLNETGEVIFEFKQKTFGEKVDVEQLFEVLHIETEQQNEWTL